MEVSLHEVGRFRQGEMELIFAVQDHLELAAVQIEHVAPLLMVIAEQMEVVSRHVDGAGKAGIRPDGR